MSVFKRIVDTFKAPSTVTKPTEQKVSGTENSWAFGYSNTTELVRSNATFERNWVARYHEMIDHDHLVRAFASTLQLLFSNMDFSLEREEGEEDDTLHELAEKMFTDWGKGDWNTFLREYVSTFLFGFSVFELVLRQGETGYEVDDLVFHPQIYLTAEWEDSATLKGFSSRLTDTPLDIARLMYAQGVGNFNHSPYGQSLLRAAYIHYRNKTQIMASEIYHVKANLEGIPVVRMDTSEDGWKESWARVQQSLKDIKRGHGSGVMLSSNTFTDADGRITNVRRNDIDLMSVGGSKFIDTNALVQREDTAIARALMAEFLVMVGQNTGSYALSKETTSMFKLLVEGMAQHLCDTFNHQVIKPLWVLNGQDYQTMPKLTYDSAGLSLEAMAVFINALSSAGVTLSESQQEYLFEFGGLPKPTEEERLEEQASLLMMGPVDTQATQEPVQQGEAGPSEEINGDES